jgi:hypothetical protein
MGAIEVLDGAVVSLVSQRVVSKGTVQMSFNTLSFVFKSFVCAFVLTVQKCITVASQTRERGGGGRGQREWGVCLTVSLPSFPLWLRIFFLIAFSEPSAEQSTVKQRRKRERERRETKRKGIGSKATTETRERECVCVCVERERDLEMRQR